MLVAPFAGSQAVAQTHNLTGTVVDAQGNPVAGAAVVIDGTTKGTSTAVMNPRRLRSAHRRI